MAVEFTSGIVSGAVALERRLQMIAHNLANLDTPGFKREVMALKARIVGQGGYPLMVEIAERVPDLSPGAMRPTGNPLDLAIGSEGFFVVETPRGIRYTRKGAFRVDGEGYLVTSQGYRVLGKGGAVVLEGGEVVVNEAGEIVLGGEVVDSLRVVSFPKGAKLIREGDGLFRFEGADAEIIEVETPQLKQGFLEGSNVSAVLEMVKLIEVSRVFEAYQRALHTIDDIARGALEEIMKA